MPGWLKALLLVIALLVVGLIVAATFAYRAVSSQMTQMQSGMAKSQSDGAAYGAGKHPADCIEEALRRAERTFTGQMQTRIFVDACLKASTPPPGWCDSVPDSFQGVVWANAQCARRNLAGDQTCGAVYQGVVQYCHSPH